MKKQKDILEIKKLAKQMIDLQNFIENKLGGKKKIMSIWKKYYDTEGRWDDFINEDVGGYKINEDNIEFYWYTKGREWYVPHPGYNSFKLPLDMFLLTDEELK